MMKCFVLCVLAVATLRPHVHAYIADEMASQIKKCCDDGHQFARGHSAEECGGELPSSSPVREEFQSMCNTAKSQCCREYILQKNECERAVDILISNKNCDYTKGVSRLCCEECTRGEKVGAQDGYSACTRSPPGNRTEDLIAYDAFTRCCQGVSLGGSASRGAPQPARMLAALPSTCEEYAPNELCAHHCIPVPGSYRCECNPGFMLMADGRNCKEVTKNRCKPRNNCQHKCNDNGVEVKCSCRRGFELMADGTSCQDIDECQLDVSVCLPGTRCHNIEGSYRCIPLKKEHPCPAGYVRNEDNNVCDDINECLLPAPPCAPSICENTIGGYLCGGVLGSPAKIARDSDRIAVPSSPEEDQCPPGFQIGASGECEDVDECQTQKHDCNLLSQLCINTHASYHCMDKASRHCPPGFKRDDATGTCQDINECEVSEGQGQAVCRNDQVCVNQLGQYDCKPIAENSYDLSCPEGMRKKEGSPYCEDIDECLENIHICDVHQQCLNTNGSYDCHCKLGYELDINTGACIDLNECATGQHNCLPQLQRCDNTVGSYLCVRIAPCGTGYVLNHATGQCEDIDECALGTHNCGAHFSCYNLRGSFRCSRRRTTTTTAAPPAAPDYEYYYDSEEEVATPPKDPLNPLALPPDEHNPEAQDPELDGLGDNFDVFNRVPNNVDADAARPAEAVPKPKVSTTPPPSSVTVPDPTESQLNETQQKSVQPTLTPSTLQFKPTEQISTSTEPPSTPSTPFKPTQQTSTPSQPTPTLTTPQFTPITQKSWPPVLASTQSTHQFNPTEQKSTVTESPPKRTTPKTTPIEEQPTSPTPDPNTTVQKSKSDSRRLHPAQPGPRPTEWTPYQPQQTTYESTDKQYQPHPKSPIIPPEIPAAELPRTTQQRPTPSVPDQQGYNEATIPERHTGRSHSKGSKTPHFVDVNVGEKEATITGDRTEDGSVIIDTKNIPQNKWIAITTSNIECPFGFEPDEFGSCFDIDECATNRHSCSGLTEVCKNTIGGYTCNCAAGFRRDLVTKACDVITTSSTTTTTTTATPPLLVPTTSGKSFWGYPVNHVTLRPFRPRNLCDAGFHYNQKTHNCEDIDECNNGQANCAAVEICTNTVGGYKCECPPNWRLDELRHRCMPYSHYGQHIPPGYSNEPVFSTVRPAIVLSRTDTKYEPEITQVEDQGSVLTCPAGYSLGDDNTCIDINECATGAASCGPQQICVNLAGGYSCNCPAGHRLVSDHRCEDVDECAAAGLPVCSQNADCVNTVGSYMCQCHTGFRPAPVNDKVCVDVDECAGARPGELCQHRCNNVWGSYRCSCHRGYRLMPDNSTCADVDECVEFKSKVPCVGKCINEPGSYRCACPKGYKLSEDKRSCIDIDECETGEAACAAGEASRSSHDVCVNTRGAYRCHRISCPPGYRLQNKHRCSKMELVCQPGDWNCTRQPTTISYNFITFVSNLYIPDSELKLFTMKGPVWSNAKMRFELRMVDVNAPPSVKKKADINDFLLTQKTNFEGLMSLVRPLEGPQSIELEMSMDVYTDEHFGGTAVAKLFIYVSEYEF